MQKYKENPWWWYGILLFLSFIAGKPFKFFMPEFCWIFLIGLIVVTKGQTTLPWWSYIVALLVGAFVTVSYILHNKIIFM